MRQEQLEIFMRRALELAQKGRFRACPNPATGAVLVKNGEIVAEGWHEKAGEAHAEIACLDDCRSRGINPEGALMAVTLEPCVHVGRTGPCADALQKAKIGALAYGTTDPNPLARGGAAKLAGNGVTVFGPILEQECKDLIADFTVWQKTGRPYVLLKLASTLDGRIATRSGDSRWISGEEARQEVHRLRSLLGEGGGLVLVGGETFRQDNPLLNARTKCEKQPLAGVLCSYLPPMALDSQLVRTRASDTIFFVPEQENREPEAQALQKAGCRICPVPVTETGKADLHYLLDYIRQKLGCHYVLCEGGGKLGLSLLEEGLTDEFHLYIAPIILGDESAKPLFQGRSPNLLKEALHMRLCSTLQKGADLMLTLRPCAQIGERTCSRV